MGSKWETGLEGGTGMGGTGDASLQGRLAGLWAPRRTGWEFPRTICTHQGVGGAPSGVGSVSA